MPTSREQLAQHVEELVRRAARQLSPDMVRALERAVEEETDPTAEGVLQTILDKAHAPEIKNRGLSADTGLPTFFVRAGCSFPALSELHQALGDATAAATKHVPLAAHTADVFTGKALRTNTGRGVPIVHTEVVPGAEDAQVTVYLKGAASETLTALWMLPPTTTMEELGDRLASHLADGGGRPCPPIVVGIGLGGTPESAMMMSRKALLRRVGDPAREAELASHERAWRTAMNATGIGAMGLGGNVSVLAVHAEAADRHAAILPVAVSVACWCDRKATVSIDRHGAVHW